MIIGIWGNMQWPRTESDELNVSIAQNNKFAGVELYAISQKSDVLERLNGKNLNKIVKNSKLLFYGSNAKLISYNNQAWNSVGAAAAVPSSSKQWPHNHKLPPKESVKYRVNAGQ